jgi:hypothetical protein
MPHQASGLLDWPRGDLIKKSSQNGAVFPVFVVRYWGI